MLRFRFPLAALENLLASREDQAKALAGRAAADRQRAETLLAHLERLRGSVRSEQRRRRHDGTLPPREEKLYLDYFRAIGGVLDAQGQDAARAAREHGARQRDLRQAATRHKTLVLLRERRLADHRHRQLRKLTARLDDVALAQYLREGANDPREPTPAA